MAPSPKVQRNVTPNKSSLASGFKKPVALQKVEIRQKALLALDIATPRGNKPNTARHATTSIKKPITRQQEFNAGMESATPTAPTTSSKKPVWKWQLKPAPLGFPSPIKGQRNKEGKWTPKPAHSGVPVPEKMRKLLEKRLECLTELHVVSGSLDTSIRVWDVETGQLKHTLTGHQSLTSGMELISNILVSGNADSTVKVWDITTGHCLHTLSGPNKHQSAVTCLQSSSRYVITSSDDGTVKLWNVRTGEFIRNLVELSSGGSGGVVWRIRASTTKLICAVGSRNGTEETLVLNFDIPGACRKCDE